MAGGAPGPPVRGGHLSLVSGLALCRVYPRALAQLYHLRSIYGLSDPRHTPRGGVWGAPPSDPVLKDSVVSRLPVVQGTFAPMERNLFFSAAASRNFENGSTSSP